MKTVKNFLIRVALDLSLVFTLLFIGCALVKQTITSAAVGAGIGGISAGPPGAVVGAGVGSVAGLVIGITDVNEASAELKREK